MTQNEDKETFRININSRYAAISTDGRQFRLLTSGNPRNAPWITGLENLNRTLVAKAGWRPWDLQTYDETTQLLRSRLSGFQRLQTANPNKPHRLSFSAGDFRLVWTPPTTNGGGNQWTLANPAKTIARMPEANNAVGYYHDLHRAVWVAIERSVLASDETIEYTALSEFVLNVAKSLTADLKVEAGR